MAGSASRSTEQVKEQEKQTQREAARLTPCCIPGKSGEECPGLWCLSLVQPQGMAPSSPRPLGSSCPLIVFLGG